MKKILSILFFFLYLFIVGCNKADNLSFVNKFDNANFSAFRNTGFNIRGGDERRNLIVFVSHDLKNAFQKSPIIIIIDPDSKKILDFSFKLLKDSSNVDKEKLQRLVIQFLSFKVNSLSVDTNENVFVRLQASDRPALARFADKKYVATADPFKGKWQHLKNNWYEIKD